MWRLGRAVTDLEFDEKDRVWRSTLHHKGEEYHLETLVHKGEIVRTNLRGWPEVPIPDSIPIKKVEIKIRKLMNAYQRHADYYHELGKHWLDEPEDRLQIELARRREQLGLIKPRE